MISNLRIGNSCGSCISTNKPRTPHKHAAHYEVAKTERWCFKHSRNVTRETVCDDYEGVNSSSKKSFTRIKNFNKRVEKINEIVELLGENGEIEVFNDYTFYVHNNSLFHYNNKYSYRKDFSNYVSSKSSSNDRYIEFILNKLKNENG